MSNSLLERIIYVLPQFIGTFGLIPLVIFGYISQNDEKSQHVISLTALLLGATLAITYFIADLYPYSRPPTYDKALTCGANVAVSYMIAAATMYSWLHRTGMYYYYLLWLILHSCVMIFPCFILLILPNE